MLENLRQMSLPRRVAAAIVALTIVATICFAVYFAFFRVQYETLYAGLRPAETAAIAEELDKTGIGYELADDGSTILVASPDVARSKTIVASSELSLNGLVGFELFNESDMGLTEFAQKVNYQRAIQGELVRTIMMMDGIESARVHLSLPARTLFRRDETAPKAAVTVQSLPGRSLDQAAVLGIRELVSASVTGLDIANVAVLDNSGKIMGGQAAFAVAESPELSEKRAVQEYYGARARRVLESSFGGYKADVAVAIVQSDADTDRIFAFPQDRQSEPADDANADSGKSEPTRNFGLRVSLIFPATPDPETANLMRNAVAEALQLSTKTGDSIVFLSNPPRPLEDDTQPALSMQSAPPLAQESAFHDANSNFGNALIWTGCFALFLFAILMWMRRKNHAGDKLTLQERMSFAETLESSLAANGATKNA